MNASEPTSPTSPVAVYPPPASSEDDDTPGTAAEFYGFVAWATTAILWFIYISWALLPDSVIRGMGITWYPNREWALLIPSYAVFLVLLTYFTYFALAIYATPSYSEVKSITDEHAHYRPMGRTSLPAHDSRTTVPQVHDLPIGLVNRVLYVMEQGFGAGKFGRIKE
ncbi:PIG-P-domain-containing protein [Rhizoctonia solani]|nr:PIG-P-domain-containing protein [Rhizoctonia solani]